MTRRAAVRAGAFYQADPETCKAQATQLLEGVSVPPDLPDHRRGGLLPHAGWVYSGHVAALTIKTVCRSVPPPRTLILFGADHTGSVRRGEVWSDGAWETPLGDLEVDEELARRLLQSSDLLRANPQAHQVEHSIEVQAPLIKAMDPQIKVVPVAVPATEIAAEIGQAVGETIASGDDSESIAVLGSTDLTHHGGHFGNPGGYGPDSEEFARKNDQRILELIVNFKIDQIVPEAHTHHNACGAGAIAATLSAVRQLGVTTARLLQYTNSYRVIRQIDPNPRDDTTVGYASVVFLQG